jgi:hypothetical protein
MVQSRKRVGKPANTIASGEELYGERNYFEGVSNEEGRLSSRTAFVSSKPMPAALPYGGKISTDHNHCQMCVQSTKLSGLVLGTPPEAARFDGRLFSRRDQSRQKNCATKVHRIIMTRCSDTSSDYKMSASRATALACLVGAISTNPSRIGFRGEDRPPVLHPQLAISGLYGNLVRQRL